MTSANVEIRDRAVRDLSTTLIIGLCCLLVYNMNGRAITAADTYPARYLPFAIWRYHTVVLDPIAPITAQGRGPTAFWMLDVPGGHTISLYPVVLPVVLAPLYLPAIVYLNLHDWADWRLDQTARVMEKLSASLIAALSASLLYRVLRRRATMSIALLLTFAYAFGTSTWMIGSQALWQHGMAELLIVSALLVLTGRCTAPRAIAAGLLCGLIAGNRPPDLILAAALGAYGLLWARRRAALLVAAAALPMGLVLLYNLTVAHHFAGAYGSAGKAAFFDHDLLPGIGGLLFSPTRGLFVFSPFLLFLVLALWHLPRDRGERVLTLAMSVGIVLQLFLYAKADWRGGVSWGPRFLTDLLPLLVWMLVPVVVALGEMGRGFFVLAVTAAVMIEAIGAFYYTGASDRDIFAVASGPDEMKAAWDWRNAPFIASLQDGLAPRDLLLEIRGHLDAIETEGGATSTVTAGQKIVVSGWALADNQTPRQVAVIIDGQQPVASRTFFDRPDVHLAQNETSPAGWRVQLKTAGLAPGEHHLTALVWAVGNNDGHYLGERTFIVRSEDDLRASFNTAVSRLRAHQQTPGYWLTTYTSSTQFQQPHDEMNTFTTSLLVELLEPLQTTAHLGDALQRARTHLTAQIETNGLVRYHGRPDAPTIGKLGCVITPDADDTALVWRLAPDPDRRRLTAALATIKQYRTAEGLYRTWLAPRHAYQCIDPGRDPDPTDIAIQMHVLLLLAKVQPQSGRSLCEALRPVIDEDRIWVYYRKTPIVPMLRMPDLQRAGCKLQLSESRMRTQIPEQGIWVSLVRLLAGADNAAEVESVLRQIAKDDFALIRKNPPLLYHNDLTATVSRYYWSEDVGYALWLRLYDLNEHIRQLPHAG